MLSAAVDMLEHLGHTAHANIIQMAIDKTINEDHIHTPGNSFKFIEKKSIILIYYLALFLTRSGWSGHEYRRRADHRQAHPRNDQGQELVKCYSAPQ
jgi:hypothetical protein